MIDTMDLSCQTDRQRQKTWTTPGGELYNECFYFWKTHCECFIFCSQAATALAEGPAVPTPLYSTALPEGPKVPTHPSTVQL